MKKGIIVFFSVLLTVIVFFNFILEDLVKNKLGDLLKTTFGDYYTLTFSENYTRLSPSGFSFGFSDVDVTSDTTNQVMMSKFSPIFFTAKQLEVNNISILNLLLNSEIDIASFKLTDPELVFLITPKSVGPATVEATDEESANLISEIEASAFLVEGGSAAFVFVNHQQDTLYAGNDLNVSLRKLNVLINENGIKPEQITAEGFTLSLQDALYNPSSSSYKYQMDAMHLDYEEALFSCSNIKLIPKQSLYALTLDEQYQKTMFDISIGSFQLKDIQLDSLKNTGALRASTGILKDATFSLLRNANHPLAPEAKVLMHESLANSSFPIDIDTLSIENALIDYRLIPKGKVKSGEVILRHINGYLAGIYSEDDKKDTLKLFLESDFLANGKFSFAADFPLKGVPQHSYQGHISQLPFTDLNAIVTPMVNVQLNEGMVEDIYFTGVCSDRITSGQMIFDYDNLKMQVNSAKKEKRKWLVSDIGSLIVRHQSKKDKDGRSIAVDYRYERPTYQGHIGFYLNGLLDGMMKTLLPTPAYKAAIKGMTPSLD